MRPLAAAVILVAALACSDGYRRATPPAATVDPDLGTTAEPPEPPEPQPPQPPQPDVDGDGRADAVTTLTSGDPDAVGWRWGLRVAMTGLGTQTVWNDCCPDGVQYDVVGDVDGDGDVELAGVYGTTASASGWFLVTVHGGRLSIVDGPQLDRGLTEGGETTWSCAGREIVVATAAFMGTTGTRTYYRLDGTRLVRTRQVRDRWSAGAEPPPEYTRVAGC